MPASAGVPIRPKPGQASQAPRWLTWAFVAYAASTLISQAVMSIGAALLAVALWAAFGGFGGLWSALRECVSLPLVRRYAFVSAALAAAVAISLGVAWASPFGWDGQFVHPQVLAGIAKVWYFAWPLLMLTGLRKLDSASRLQVIRGWLIAFVLVSAMGIVQYFTGWPREQPIPGNDGRFHATLLLGHHLSVSSILIFPFFAALELFRRRAIPAVLPRGLLGAAVVLGGVCLFMTYSRMLWLALPVGIAVWFLGVLPRRRALLAVAALALAAAGLAQVPAIHQRLLTIHGPGAMGVFEREKLWKANLEFLRLRPLTGAGYRVNDEASGIYLKSISGGGSVFTGHAHNNLLEMLGGTGILGAAAWLAWCFLVFRFLRAGLPPGGEARSAESFAWGLACAWLVFHINGLTQVNFWEGKVMHQTMWVLAWSMLWARDA